VRVLLDEGDLDGVLSVGFDEHGVDGDGCLHFDGAPDVETLDGMRLESSGLDLLLGRLHNVVLQFTCVLSDARLDLNRVDDYFFACVHEGELII
jgi:hypothetical protein